MIRVGIGTDKHRLAFGKPLLLGGVKVESGKGAIGHSDADTLAHAVIDAVLGAAGLGDIGHHFPDDDPQWAGADSIEMLKKVASIIQSGGFKVVNVDAIVHIQTPKLGRDKQKMAGNLANALGIPSHTVNVKAKSGEQVGPIGREEAISATAVVLLTRNE